MTKATNPETLLQLTSSMTNAPIGNMLKGSKVKKKKKNIYQAQQPARKNSQHLNSSKRDAVGQSKPCQKFYHFTKSIK